MEDWYAAVEKKIQKAIEDGVFDHLPGKGKPIEWDDNPWEDPERATAHRMLRKAGFTLPWIAEWQEIEQDIDAARRRLIEVWQWLRGHAAAQHHTAAQEWEDAVTAFRTTLAAINKRIQLHNMKVPNDSFQRLPVRADREIAIITGQHDAS
jgi:DnaJ family protein C protein 28